METDLISKKSVLDNIFTTFLLEYGYSNVLKYLEFGYVFGYLLNLKDNIYQFLQLQNYIKTKVSIPNKFGHRSVIKNITFIHIYFNN
jgi:hypothetical protein